MATRFSPLLAVLSCAVLLGCTSSKNAVYFTNQPNAVITSPNTINPSIIRSNDLLSINVSSLNPDATVVFNTPNTTLTATSSSPSTGPVVQTTGYLVRADGSIQFPVIGNTNAAGLTTNQLADRLKKTLIDKKLLVDPIVTVRYLNFRVTVLGEVNKPAVINVPDEKISLLEALGLAGDITIFGKKDNVMIIREEAGTKIVQRVNLNTSEIFESPYYYLKSNDIVYVEPNKAKVASSTRTTQVLPILLGGLSFAAIIVDRLTR